VETNHYGHIPEGAYCKAIRSVMMQGVRSMTRSLDGGPLQAKSGALAGRINRRKSAVAMAGKMAD